VDSRRADITEARVCVCYSHLAKAECSPYNSRRSNVSLEPWRPRAGDLIVSNWSSWIEILWLAFRSVYLGFMAHGTNDADRSFDPIFVLPVSNNDLVQQQDTLHETRTTGRKTGTGSAAISLPGRPITQRAKIVGFCKASLFRMVLSTGNTPLSASTCNYSSLEEIRRTANRPLVIFPECTTSNGRGLLKFAEVFKDRVVPVKGYKVFLMCIRCVCTGNLFCTRGSNVCVGMTHPRPCLRRYHIPSRPH
jgi:hypothetical protein